MDIMTEKKALDNVIMLTKEDKIAWQRVPPGLRGNRYKAQFKNVDLVFETSFGGGILSINGAEIFGLPSKRLRELRREIKQNYTRNEEKIREKMEEEKTGRHEEGVKILANL